MGLRADSTPTLEGFDSPAAHQKGTADVRFHLDARPVEPGDLRNGLALFIEPTTPNTENPMKNERLVHLKVKIKSLSAEAGIIRQEEEKALARHREKVGDEEGKIPPEKSLCPRYEGLRNHRTGIVRWAARHNLLAYAFLRDQSYAEVEAQGSEEPNWDEVKKVALRFEGDASTHEARWGAWVKAAKEHRARPAEQAA